MRKYALLILFQIYGTVVLMAQTQNRITFDTSKVDIPMSRVMWHENIDKEQKRTDKVDGKVDNFLKLTANEDLNIQITDVILREVDEMQLRIERGTGDNNFKLGQLRSLRELLQAIAGRAKEKEIPPMIPLLFTSYEEVMKRQASGQSVISVFEKLPYQGTEILSGIFTQLKEVQQIKNMAFLKKVQINPSNILSGIAAFADQPFADSLIEVAANKIPLECILMLRLLKRLLHRLYAATKIRRCKPLQSSAAL